MGFSPLLKCVERDCGQVDRVLLMTVDSWRSAFGIQRSANKHSGTSANTRMFTSWRSTFGIQRSANKHSGTSANTRIFTSCHSTFGIQLPAFTHYVPPADTRSVTGLVLFVDC